jgi:ketosteroid isomerase-like protein
MTHEELVRHTFDVFNERGLDGAVESFWHPDVVYHEAPDFPGAGTFRGRAAVLARFAEYVDLLGTTRADVERVDVRGDRVAWTVRFTGRSSEGVPNSHVWGYVGQIAGGLMTECRAYYNADDAFEALESAD